MPKNCSNCNKSDCTLSCSGCKLGVYYCSRECQRADWERVHKVDCKLAKVFNDLDQTKLELDYDHDDRRNKNYDGALSFAKRFMKKVNHLVINLNQAGMWNQDEMLDFGMKEPLITFTYEALYDYLESTPLVAFDLNCEECIDHQVAIITKQGKVFKSLSRSPTLRRFHISNMPIKKISYLPLALPLKSLSLNGVKLAKWDGPLGWQPEDTETMVSRLSGMEQLETLKLYSVPIQDNHLETLLSNLSSLRTLQISGTFGESNLYASNIGRITNRGCETIARLQGSNLQSLRLEYQRAITKVGAMTILQQCPHLRHLELDDARLSASDIPSLLAASSSLLIFHFSRLAGGNDLSHLGEAARATEGRTLLCSSTGGLISDVPGLTERQKRQAVHSKQLVEDDVYGVEDRNLYNVWAQLWGVDVMLP